MPVASANQLLGKLESARELPTIPAVLVPLLRYMERPSDTLDIHQVVKLISQDKSLAARCLQVANSPLFGCSHEVETIQAAVVALGLNRIQEIAVSCSLLRLLPAVSFGVNPSVFWAHSLACAMVAREFASRIGFPDPAKAYAAGLLHDVGIVALLWVSPHDFRRSFERGSAERIPLHEAEEKTLGITHCECGKIIARNWHLPPELAEAIACHHSPRQAVGNPGLTSIVSVSDLLCRLGGLGYGYTEDKQTNFAEEPGFAILSAQYRSLQPFDLARFTFETEGLLEEVRAVVARVYGSLH
jgi:putative nucleotidyltransferase with HDIG domain